MNRKWLAFPLSAGILLVLGIIISPGPSKANDDESPLGKVMEKVNKNNSTITKGDAQQGEFREVAEGRGEERQGIRQAGKEAKPFKDAFKKSKAADPQKKWDEYMDDFIKTSEDLAALVGKADASQVDAKAAFDKVKKTCADCHNDFRVEE